MSIRLMQRAWDTDLPSTQKLVLLALADQANDRGVAWPHIGSLAKRCGASRRSAFDALAELEAAGYIARETKPGIDVMVRLHPQRWERRRK